MSLKSEWLRPKSTLGPHNAGEMVFMPIDIDFYIQGHAKNRYAKYTVIRLYGATTLGNSVIAHIHAYLPYLLAECEEAKANPSTSAEVRTQLNSLKKIKNLVKATEVFAENGNFFIKIFTNLPKNIALIRHEINLGAIQDLTGSTATSQSYVPYTLQFLIDNKISSNIWLKVVLKEHAIRKSVAQTSTVQLEFDIISSDFSIYEGFFNGPLIRVLSFDIECSSDGKTFPTPTTHEIIQIGVICKVLGNANMISKCVFTLGDCEEIPDVDLFCFEKEQEMLRAFREHFLAMDPDVVTGYNMSNFDFNYLFLRAEHLGIKKFEYFGRDLNSKSTIKKTTFKSRGQGLRETKETHINGRIIQDVYRVVHQDYLLGHYTLAHVSSVFLDDTKGDVPYNTLKDLQAGSKASRKKIAIYCLKDCELPLRLLEKLKTLQEILTDKLPSPLKIEEAKAKFQAKEEFNLKHPDEATSEITGSIYSDLPNPLSNDPYNYKDPSSYKFNPSSKYVSVPSHTIVNSSEPNLKRFRLN